MKSISLKILSLAMTKMSYEYEDIMLIGDLNLTVEYKILWIYLIWND